MLGRYKKLRTQRTMEQLRHHYEVEKGIADRLRRSSREERTEITKTMYDELFSQVPDHPRLTERHDPKHAEIYASRQLLLLKHCLKPEHSFVEFGPGSCALSIAVCSKVKSVYAVDIVEKSNPGVEKPDNFNFIVYDSMNLELPDNSIDVVFSNQMIEHLHPDDTVEHFRLVHRLLKPGGIYVFCTPQKYSGPFDVSRYFSDVPQGFHLREWSFRELAELAKSLGFSRWQGRWYTSGICFWLPKRLILAFERLISILPVKVRQRYGRYILPSVTMIVQK